jgi:hypothetical protein
LNIKIAEPEKTKWTIIRIERGGGVSPESSEGPPALGTDWQKIPFSMAQSAGLSGRSNRRWRRETSRSVKQGIG